MYSRLLTEGHSVFTAGLLLVFVGNMIPFPYSVTEIKML